MPLIGTRGWDPTGESMWGVVTKLADFNYLNWADVKRLCGPNGLKSFSKPAQQSPDDQTNFHLTGLSISSGWRLEQLRASFSTWYLPPWLDETRHLSSVDDYPQLRVCPACLQEGVHLIVHQLHDWIRCPIHRANLSSNCPECGMPIGEFSIKAPVEHLGFCSNCNRRLLHCGQQSEWLRDARRQFLAEYTSWITAISGLLWEQNHRYRWIVRPYLYRHLAHAHQILPGRE